MISIFWIRVVWFFSKGRSQIISFENFPKAALLILLGRRSLRWIVEMLYQKIVKC